MLLKSKKTLLNFLIDYPTNVELLDNFDVSVEPYFDKFKYKS